MISRASMLGSRGGRATLNIIRQSTSRVSFKPRSGLGVVALGSQTHARTLGTSFALRATSSREAPSTDRWEIKVLYDGDCPLCMKEIDFLRGRDQGKDKIAFVDISSPQYNPVDNAGISFEVGMERIHAILPDGKVVTNIEVFRRLYEAVGLGWVYAITKWRALPPAAALSTADFLTRDVRGPVSRAAESVYNFWAQYRLQVTGRPSIGEVLEARRRLAEGEKCGPGEACSISEAGDLGAAAPSKASEARQGAAAKTAAAQQK